MRKYIVACSSLLFAALAHSQSFSIVAAPALPSGVVSQTTTFQTDLSLRNDGPSYLYADVKLITEAAMLRSAGLPLPPYVYTFEVINSTLGRFETALQVYPDSIMENGFSGPYIFPSGAVHYWTMSLLVGPGSVPLGTYTYTMYFRAYDVACSLSRSGTLNDAQCLFYSLPVGTTSITWAAAPPPPPPPPPAIPVYPMRNNYPPGANPPNNFPVSTFLTCTSTGCR